MSDATSRDVPARRADPSRCVQKFVELWERGSGPELAEFAAAIPDVSADELAELARIDQRRRWDQSDFVAAEVYLEQFPKLRDESSAVVDLVFGEYLLLEQRGEKPSEHEFTSRFPEYAVPLAARIQFHQQTVAASTQSAEQDSRQTLAARAADLEQTVDGYPHLDTNTEQSLPTRFGRYEILQLLGRGGMGEVYLARDSLLEREVALKIPRFDRQEKEAIERFQREARLAARFTHPNLCAIYDVGQIAGVHYLSLAYIKGDTLATCLAREQRLPVERAVYLAVQIANAVAEAHRAGIVHRDLKPGNVLLNERGEPVVTDFGLARRVVPVDGLLTSAGSIVGTPAYAAPEQLAGETDLGPAVDVYSLCVILFEMLTGRLPFEGPVGLMISQAINDPPPALRSIRPELTARLEQIVLQGLAKKPGERWSSLQELATALGSADQQPRSVAKPTLVPKQERPVDLRTISLIAVSAIIIGGLIFAAWQMAQRPPLARPSAQPDAPAVSALPRDLLSEFVADPKRQLPDGWQRQPSALVSSSGVVVNNLKWEGRLPPAYRIDCQFTAITPDDTLYWVLPVDSEHCLFGFNTYPDDEQVWHGFGAIDFQPINSNPTGQQAPKTKPGAAFRLRIDVRLTDESATLNAQLNDDPAISWEGPVTKLSVAETFRWPEKDQFGIGTVNSAYRIDSLTMTPLPK